MSMNDDQDKCCSTKMICTPDRIMGLPQHGSFTDRPLNRLMVRIIPQSCPSFQSATPGASPQVGAIYEEPIPNLSLALHSFVSIFILQTSSSYAISPSSSPISFSHSDRFSPFFPICPFLPSFTLSIPPIHQSSLYQYVALWRGRLAVRTDWL